VLPKPQKKSMADSFVKPNQVGEVSFNAIWSQKILFFHRIMGGF